VKWLYFRFGARVIAKPYSLFCIELGCRTHSVVDLRVVPSERLKLDGEERQHQPVGFARFNDLLLSGGDVVAVELREQQFGFTNHTGNATFDAMMRASHLGMSVDRRASFANECRGSTGVAVNFYELHQQTVGSNNNPERG
jgi:hypothetical protein